MCSIRLGGMNRRPPFVLKDVIPRSLRLVLQDYSNVIASDLATASHPDDSGDDVAGVDWMEEAKQMPLSLALERMDELDMLTVIEENYAAELKNPNFNGKLNNKSLSKAAIGDVQSFLASVNGTKGGRTARLTNWKALGKALHAHESQLIMDDFEVMMIQMDGREVPGMKVKRTHDGHELLFVSTESKDNRVSELMCRYSLSHRSSNRQIWVYDVADMVPPVLVCTTPSTAIKNSIWIKWNVLPIY
jgi:hypothetical protein